MPYGVGATGADVCEVLLFDGGYSDGIYEVIFVVRVGDICGLLATLDYGEGLIFLNAGGEFGGAEFSYAVFDGQVNILIDGTENTDVTLVRLYFALSGEGFGRHVRIADVEICAINEGGIAKRNAEVLCRSVEVGENEENAEGWPALPCLVSCDIDRREGEAVLHVSGMACHDFFAAGVELFIVRGGIGEKMLVVGVIDRTGDGEFELSVSLGTCEPYAIIVTPVAFEKSGCAAGEKAVILW